MLARVLQVDTQAGRLSLGMKPSYLGEAGEAGKAGAAAGPGGGRQQAEQSGDVEGGSGSDGDFDEAVEAALQVRCL